MKRLLTVTAEFKRAAVSRVAAGNEHAATLAALTAMYIMPILSRRKSADIRHNIAQFCQGGSFLPPSYGQGYRAWRFPSSRPRPGGPSGETFSPR